MIEINWSDVINILNQIKIHLIVLGIIIVAAVVAAIAVKGMAKPKKYLVRTQSGIAVVLAVLIVVNMILTGPLANILTLATAPVKEISQEASRNAEELGELIAEEGIVLMQNDDDILPLKDSNVNVFGWASSYPVYGGTGSGALSDAYHIADLLEGLGNAGIKTNTGLSDFYTSYREGRPEVGMWEQDWTLPEPPVDTYPSDLIDGAKEFSDTAIVVLARSGGEHIDLPRSMEGINYTNNGSYEDFPEGTHYLEPSQTEYNLLGMVCENFENVILLYNGANTMEMGFVKDYPQIKGVVWCPGTGQNGFNGLGEILAGNVNPSGKAADTFVSDLTATPTWNTFDAFTYTNMDEFKGPADDPYMPGNTPHFINYSEGIYVGYRYYETAAAEKLIDYDEAVVYPFGHGLSYTTFSQEMGEITENNGTISFDVNVTNTGDTAGKDVVEVFYNPPYTNGGIEKSTANLIAFEKTGLLEPGASETVSVSFAVEDMASFDTYGAGAYVLEEGDYVISINSNSHDVIDSQTYTVDKTVTYGEGNKRESDQTAAAPQFAFAEGADHIYLSRADGFANYEEATARPVSTEMAEEDKAHFTNNGNWTPTEDPNIEMPATGADNGLTLTDMRGLSYDDPQWEKLLDQLTVEEMVDLVALGGYQTVAAPSVGKVATTDCDGPASINNSFTGQGSIGFPCGVMIANTWNKEIAYQFGDSIGQMADDMGVSGWYAPAMNMHRNAFSGRNFEYYSEDGYLSGKIASQAMQGSWAHGVYAYIKHFAMNEMETNRWGMLTTWSNEQAIREIYLKPFEICVKEGNEAGTITAVMTSYNYIGSEWAGACNALLNTVLRDEWGYEGFCLTDYFANFYYMDATRSIYNGGNSCLINQDQTSNYVTVTAADTATASDATTVSHLREAVHGILYVTGNSRAHEAENIDTGAPVWKTVLIAVDVVIILLLLALEIFVVRKGYQKRKAAE